MENQELMRYLKDAIEQETSIVEQENAISEYDRLSLLRKPKQQIDRYPANPQKRTPEESKVYRFIAIYAICASLIFMALLVAAIFLNSYSNFYEYSLTETRALYKQAVANGGYVRVGRDYEDADDLLEEINEMESDKNTGTIALVIAGLAAVVLAAGFRSHILYNKQIQTANEQAQRDYEKASRDIEQRNSLNASQFKHDLSTWTQTNTEMHAYMSKPLAESRALLDRFYASEIIYPKYRTLPALTSIYEYFMTGRCTELTGPHGAYNLYEDELRKDTVISQLNTVIENLEQIRQNQYMLYQQVKAIQENTAVIASELKQIKGYTIQIAQLTALNAYYAALTERNTRITMYYHL